MQALDRLYRPPSKELWQGRKDGGAARRFHESVQIIDLREPHISLLPGALGILGFACDEGVLRNQGRTGAAEGPAALRKALAKLPFPWREKKLYDFGDVICPNGNLEEAQGLLGATVAHLHQRNIFPVLFGGGHEIAWAHYQGLCAGYPQKKIGIINFDAHFDLRPLLEGNKGSSGTSFLQIANQCIEKQMPFDYLCLGVQSASNSEDLFDKAKELNVRYITAEDIYLQPLQSVEAEIARFLSHNQKVYLTVCLDVFAAAFAPGVSAPQALGLAPWQVVGLFKSIAASKKVVGFDIAELCPAQDRDVITANLAAGLVFQYLNASFG